MLTDQNTTGLLCLDPAYSTTRLLTRVTPIIEILTDSKFTSVLFLPEGEGRKGEGGLRTQGYFKKSLPDKPLITVITVVFNAEKSLEETILSVIKKTCENIEFIVIDGGSTDSTIDIIKKYGGQIDYWVSEKDDGIYDAMNKGLVCATGEWCLFVGADDTLLDGFENILPLLKNRGSMYYGSVLSDDKRIGGKFNRWKILRNNIPHQAIFYPRTFYVRNLYLNKYRICADHEYNIRLFYGKITTKYLDIVISRFGCYGVSSLHIDDNFQRDYLKIVRHYSPYIFYHMILFGKRIKQILLK